MRDSITGVVVHGDGYGRKIGFPTVNLQTSKVHSPREGVYAGDAILEGKKYRAGIIIGPAEKVEAHLIGFTGDAYDKEVTLQLKKFLRPYIKFATEEELIAQIKEDLKLC